MSNAEARISYLEKQVGKFKSISLRRKTIINKLETRIEKLESEITHYKICPKKGGKPC